MDERAALNRATYDAIAPAYLARQAGRATPAVVADRVQALARGCPDGLVADLGCGPGHHRPLLEAAGLRVVGLDLSAGMLALGPGQRVQADLRSLPFGSGTFDGAWSNYALLHLDDAGLARCLHEVERVLRPGGALVAVLSVGAGALLEPVDYAEGSARWYHLHAPHRVVELCREAGLEVLSAEHDPYGWRSPLTLVARRPSR